MSKRLLKAFSIISLILCVILVLIIILNRVVMPIPTIENTTMLTLTVDNIERVNSAATYIGIKEHDGELIVYNNLVSNSVAFAGLSTGDVISIRVYTSDVDALKFRTVPVWALSANNINIITLDNSVKNRQEQSNKLLSVEVVFCCLFAVAAIICFCGYKGLLCAHKNKNNQAESN